MEYTPLGTVGMPTKVRLTRKLADILNGIDLSRAQAGEEMFVSDRDATILLAEGWAVAVNEADDKPPKPRKPNRHSSGRSVR